MAYVFQKVLSSLRLFEPSAFNYPSLRTCFWLHEQAMPVMVAGTGPLRFDGSKGTAVEAMVPEPEPRAGNPESRCGEANVGIRSEGQATRTRRRVDGT